MLTSVTIVLAALVLGAIVMDGSERHVRAHARLRALGAAFQGQPLTRTRHGDATSWAWQGRLGVVFYSAWMRHLLARPDSSTRARLALGTGPRTHWSGLLGGAPFATLLVLLLAGISRAFPQWEMGRALLGGSMIGFGLATIVTPLQSFSAIWTSRHEQVLLRLLPDAPQGASLNHWLAIRFASLQVAVVIALIIAVIAFAAFIKAQFEWPQLKSLVLCALVLSLAFVPAMWRDWSRLGAPSELSQLPLVFLILGLGGMAAGWVLWLEEPWWLLAAITLVVLLPVCAWRWRALGHAPAAWPAGRF